MDGDSAICVRIENARLSTMWFNCLYTNSLWVAWLLESEFQTITFFWFEIWFYIWALLQHENYRIFICGIFCVRSVGANSIAHELYFPIDTKEKKTRPSFSHAKLWLEFCVKSIITTVLEKWNKMLWERKHAETMSFVRTLFHFNFY